MTDPIVTRKPTSRQRSQSAPPSVSDSLVDPIDQSSLEEQDSLTQRRQGGLGGLPSLALNMALPPSAPPPPPSSPMSKDPHRLAKLPSGESRNARGVERPSNVVAWDAGKSDLAPTSVPEQPKNGHNFLKQAYHDKQKGADGKVTSETKWTQGGYKHEDKSGSLSIGTSGMSRTKKLNDDDSDTFGVGKDGFTIGQTRKDDKTGDTGATTVNIGPSKLGVASSTTDSEGNKRGGSGYIGRSGVGFGTEAVNVSKDEAGEKVKSSASTTGALDIEKQTLKVGNTRTTENTDGKSSTAISGGLDMKNKRVDVNYTHGSKLGTVGQDQVSHNGHVGKDGVGYTYTSMGKKDTGTVNDEGKPVLQDDLKLKAGGSINWKEKAFQAELGNADLGGKVGYNHTKKEATVGGNIKNVRGELTVGWGKTKKLAVNAGTEDYGGGFNVEHNDHTTSVGVRGMVNGYGAGIHGHRTKGKVDDVSSTDDALFDTGSTGQTVRNSRGGGLQVGVPFVKAGGHYATGETSSYGMSDQASKSYGDDDESGLRTLFGDVDEDRNERKAELLKHAKKGKDGLSFDNLQNGESLSSGSDRSGGGNVGLNYMGLAEVNAKHDRTSHRKGAIAKDDGGGLVSSYTKGGSHSTNVQAGGMFGAVSGELQFDRANEKTSGFYAKSGSSNKDTQSKLESFAKTGKGLDDTGKQIGDHVDGDIQVGHQRKVKTSTNKAKGGIGWGLIGGEVSKTSTKMTDNRLIHGGDGGRMSKSKESVVNKDGTILGFGGKSNTTHQQTSQSSFTGATKTGQTDEENQQDFKRLREMSGKENKSVSSLKVGESLAFTKQSGESKKSSDKYLFFSANKNDVTTTNTQVGQVSRTESGANVNLAGELSTKNGSLTKKQSHELTFSGDDGAFKSIDALMMGKFAASKEVAGQLKELNSKVIALEEELADIEKKGRTKKGFFKDSDITEKEMIRVGKELDTARHKLATRRVEAEREIANTAKVGTKAGEATLTSMSSVKELNATESKKVGTLGFRKKHDITQDQKLTETSKLATDGGVASTVNNKLDYKHTVEGKTKSSTSFDLNAQAEDDGTALRIVFTQTSGKEVERSQVNLDKATVKALADHYNKGEGKEAYWKRLSDRAVKAANTDEIKELHAKVLSAEDFANLETPQQFVFLRAALKGQGELANPFELIGAIESMDRDTSSKASAYSNLFTAFAQQGVTDDIKVKALTKTNGKNLSDKLGEVANEVHDTNPQLAKTLVDGMDDHLSKKDKRSKEQRVLGKKLDYRKYR